MWCAHPVCELHATTDLVVVDSSSQPTIDDPPCVALPLTCMVGAHYVSHVPPPTRICHARVVLMHMPMPLCKQYSSTHLPKFICEEQGL